MRQTHQSYIRILKHVLKEIDNIQAILKNIEKTGKTSNSIEILKIYERIFNDDKLKIHLE